MLWTANETIAMTGRGRLEELSKSLDMTLDNLLAKGAGAWWYQCNGVHYLLIAVRTGRMVQVCQVHDVASHDQASSISLALEEVAGQLGNADCVRAALGRHGIIDLAESAVRRQ
jgi:hypothetical protein